MSLDGYNLLLTYLKNGSITFGSTFGDLHRYIQGNLTNPPFRDPRWCAFDYFERRLALNGLFDGTMLTYTVLNELDHVLYCLGGAIDSEFLDYAEMRMTQIEFLMNLQLLIEKHREFPRTNTRTRRLAFTMGLHPRLGAESVVSNINGDLSKATVRYL